MIVYLNKEEAIAYIYSYKQKIKENFILSLLILIGLHVIGSLILIPNFLFAISGGFMFSTYFNGSLLGFICCFIFFLFVTGFAGLVTFLFSRFAFKAKLRQILIAGSGDQFKKINFLLSKYGTKALFLLRLSPIMPLSIYNYFIAAFDSKIYNNYI